MAFLDDFDGELSSVVLSDHTPSGGTAWTFYGGLTDGIRVTTDGYVRPARSTRTMFVCDNQGDADSYVKIETVNLNPANDTGLCLRVDDADNFWGCRLSSLPSQSGIYKVVLGIKTEVASFSTSNGKEIVFEASGNTLSVYENGALLTSTTDAFNNSHNRAGLIANANLTSYVLDNFEHGAGSYSPSQLEAQTSEVSGTGEITRNGTGAINAQASTVYGIAGANQTGSGTLTAQSSSIIGTAQTNPSGYVFIGLVQLNAQLATLAGTGSIVQSVDVTGTLQAQEASIDGATTLTRVGTGVLSPDASTIVGSGAAADITGDGALQAAAATISGVAARVTTIYSTLGQLRSGICTVDGDGYRANIIYGNEEYDVWTKIN